MILYHSQQDWSDLHVLAVGVLSLCLLAEGGMEALHSSDCLQKLLSGIRESSLPSVQAKAVSTSDLEHPPKNTRLTSFCPISHCRQQHWPELPGMVSRCIFT